MSDKVVIVYVTWVDASHDAGPVEPKDFSFPDGLILHTAGILAAESKSQISVAKDYNPATNEYRDIIHIPKSYIKSMERLKIKMPK